MTGDFTEKGLVSNVDGLTSADYEGLAGWIDFYFKDYEFVGTSCNLFLVDNLVYFQTLIAVSTSNSVASTLVQSTELQFSQFYFALGLA